MSPWSTGVLLQFANKPFAEWLDVPRGELIGEPVAEMSARSGCKDREPLYRRALAGERIFYVSEFDHPTRGPSALQSDYVPWADAAGQVHGFLVIHQDVTEQRAAERAIKESEERFRRIANSAPALMWVTRLDRVRDFVNEAYADFASAPAAATTRRGCSTGASGSTRRRRPDRRREHRRGGDAASDSRWRAGTGASTANIAGSGRCRSRASGPTGS